MRAPSPGATSGLAAVAHVFATMLAFHAPRAVTRPVTSCGKTAGGTASASARRDEAVDVGRFAEILRRRRRAGEHV